MFLKKIIIVLFLIGNYSYTNAQSTKDSLLLALKKHPKKDTVRCMQLINYYEENRTNKDVQAVNLELKNTLLEIINNKKLQQTKKEWYIILLISSLLYEGQDILKHTANYPRALQSYFLMLKYAESINNDEGKAGAYNDISTTYFKQKYYKESIEYTLKFIALSRKMKDSIFISSGLNNLARTYLSINQIDKAEKCYKEAIKIKQKVEPQRLGVIYNGLGNLWRQRKNSDSAFYYYYKALKVNKLLNLKIFYVRDYQSLALTYIDKNQPKLAEENALSSLKIANELNEPEHIKSAAAILARIYKNSNQFKKAMEMLELSSIMNDSILNDENKKSLLVAEMNYQTEKKEAKIKELDQKKKIAELQSNKKTILINSFIISFLALAIIAYFLFSRYKTQKKNELLETQLAETEKRLEAEKKATDSELKALKSQMNPHFIFNALNSIQSQFMFGNKLVANEQMSIFTNLTRQILEVSGKKQITIATETDILIKYLELEKMRFAKDFEYKISVSKNIDEDYHKIPPMLLQPLLENSIKHGLLHKKGDKKVSLNIDLSEEESYIICIIKDNGIGRLKSAEIKSKSILNHQSFSTNAIEERLKLLNNKLKLKNLIEYEDALNPDNEVCGTIVSLKIPLI